LRRAARHSGDDPCSAISIAFTRVPPPTTS
jgi:hypothetical protein